MYDGETSRDTLSAARDEVVGQDERLTNVGGLSTAREGSFSIR